ncbi:Sodium-coupled monocarboxylate transporter 2, partial [Armadillidium nasatum]
FQYMDLRFRSPGLHIFAVLISHLLIFTRIGVCVYATAIALKFVTPFGYETCILITGIVCTLYTAMGGLRAVVWTDAFQFVTMMTGLFIYIIAGVIQSGGLESVLSVAEKGQRLEFFK